LSFYRDCVFCGASIHNKAHKKCTPQQKKLTLKRLCRTLKGIATLPRMAKTGDRFFSRYSRSCGESNASFLYILIAEAFQVGRDQQTCGSNKREKMWQKIQPRQEKQRSYQRLRK